MADTGFSARETVRGGLMRALLRLAAVLAVLVAGAALTTIHPSSASPEQPAGHPLADRRQVSLAQVSQERMTVELSWRECLQRVVRLLQAGKMSGIPHRHLSPL